jgi:hypothetical protein
MNHLAPQVKVFVHQLGKLWQVLFQQRFPERTRRDMSFLTEALQSQAPNSKHILSPFPPQMPFTV